MLPDVATVLTEAVHRVVVSERSGRWGSGTKITSTTVRDTLHAVLLLGLAIGNGVQRRFFQISPCASTISSREGTMEATRLPEFSPNCYSAGETSAIENIVELLSPHQPPSYRPLGLHLHPIHRLRRLRPPL